MADIEAKFDQFMLTLPNLPNLAVKVGSNEGENREVRRLGESPKFDFTSKNHWDIGEELGILDFAGAAKIAGARAHQLHAGLTHWRGRLKEMLPPALVNRGSLVGTGQLPKSTRIYFISLPAIIFSFRPPEVPLTNLHRDEMLEREELPIKYVAYRVFERSGLLRQVRARADPPAPI